MSDVITIDTHYVLPRFAAAYLMLEGEQAAFIETNTSHCVPQLLEELRASGRRPEQVAYVIVTHVHLDHAGGASVLMRACPNAVLLCHPRAARHLIDPAKLVSSARQVYGAEAFEKLYGEILPIPAARVREMADGETLRFGRRELKFLHTRGHANHHFCVLDSHSGGIFTGDAFGLAYPALQASGTFAFPSTSPTDFDADEALRAIDRIVDSGARRAYLTHFGALEDMATAARQLKEVLRFSAGLLEEATAVPLTAGELDEFCYLRLLRFLDEWLPRTVGMPLSPNVMHWLGMDLELNAQGIAHVARKRRSAAA